MCASIYLALVKCQVHYYFMQNQCKQTTKQVVYFFDYFILWLKQKRTPVLVIIYKIFFREIYSKNIQNTFGD